MEIIWPEVAIPTRVLIQKLDAGDVFRYQGVLFMKTNPAIHVELGTGRLCSDSFFGGGLVTKVKGAFHVEG